MEPGGVYHVTARGNRRQLIFFDDRDRRVFLAMGTRDARKRAWTCHGYCLMPNHLHLVVETPSGDLSAGMQGLLSRYAIGFNRRHALDGHVFQGRFHSVAVTSDWHLVELSRYLALNPVRAGLCADPDDWEWSSFRSFIRPLPESGFLSTRRVLSLFGRTPEVASASYRRFVAEGLMLSA